MCTACSNFWRSCSIWRSLKLHSSQTDSLVNSAEAASDSDSDSDSLELSSSSDDQEDDSSLYCGSTVAIGDMRLFCADN
jgi:hypothetical protein